MSTAAEKTGMALPRVASAWPTFNREKHAFSTANQKYLLPSANLGANPAAYRYVP